jgi:pimeloyl-ACP methyl ester carboxylesterase
MKKLFFCVLFCFICGIICAQNQNKTYILVHGGWHGAWCWNKVVPLLEAKGNKVIAIDLPSHGKDKTPPETVTLDDCVKKVVEIVNQQTEPVILVGHSMSGLIISQAAEVLGAKKVAKLVYLDAFLPKKGESVMMIADKNSPMASKNRPQSFFIVSADHKTATINFEVAVNALYHDCSKEDIAFAKANLCIQSVAVLATPVKVSEEIYGKIPKVYILCTKAKDLDKSKIATNVPCEKIYKLDTSHSPFFSQPKKLAKILNKI